MAGLTYQFNYIMNILGRLLNLFAQYFIWRALLVNKPVSTASGVISFETMISYIIVSSIISTLTSNNVISTIDKKIGTGSIAMDFVKPMNFIAYIFCDSLGNNLFQFVFQLIPVAIIAIFTFGIQVPTILNFVLFLITLFLGMIIYFFICFCLGIIGFWFTQVWVLGRFLSDFVSLLSGSLIPLWFFPNTLQPLINALPFKFLYYIPISIYLGTLKSNTCMYQIIEQLLWCLILFAAALLVYSRAIKKLVVQGG